MLETLQHWTTAIGALAHQYPAISAIAIAVLLSWAPGVIWDNWFAPDGWPAKKVKQVSLGLTMLVAAAVSITCWRSFVPTDGRSLVVVVSIAAAFSAPLFHLVIGSLLDHYVPWINLDGKLKKPPP